MALIGIKWGREDGKQKSSFEQASAPVISIAVQLPVANERIEPALWDKIRLTAFYQYSLSNSFLRSSTTGFLYTVVSIIRYIKSATKQPLPRNNTKREVAP